MVSAVGVISSCRSLVSAWLDARVVLIDAEVSSVARNRGVSAGGPSSRASGRLDSASAICALFLDGR